MSVGATIQFRGLTLEPPPSAHTMNVPSLFSISSRTASDRTVLRRPTYETSQRATIRRTAGT
jgi:hypothetical protein